MLKWAQNSALYRVSRQMLSRRQLHDAVLRKAREKFDDISVEDAQTLAATAVAFADSIGALDDDAFAQAKTRSAVRGGKSQRMIARALSRKGIDKETTQAALAEADDLTAAVALSRRRAFGPFRRAEVDDARRQKELAAMVRQGFVFELVKRVSAMSREEAEEILSQMP
ncbi:regulatory protein RecX [Pararhizobium capsulatum]|nr:regulatory protein RecX [Pararhizobium capsulatum]